MLVPVFYGVDQNKTVHIDQLVNETHNGKRIEDLDGIEVLNRDDSTNSKEGVMDKILDENKILGPPRFRQVHYM